MYGEDDRAGGIVRSAWVMQANIDRMFRAVVSLHMRIFLRRNRLAVTAMRSSHPGAFEPLRRALSLAYDRAPGVVCSAGIKRPGLGSLRGRWMSGRRVSWPPGVMAAGVMAADARAAKRGPSKRAAVLVRPPGVVAAEARAAEARAAEARASWRQSSRWTRSIFSCRSCASIDIVAMGRASRRLMPMGSSVSSQKP
jgi:hypothetical protein